MNDNNNNEAAELQLHLANFKLYVLQEIIHLLPGSTNHWETLDFIMNRLFSLVEMEGASIILPDESGEKLVFHTVRGEKEAVLTGMEMPAGKGIAGKVYLSGEPFLLDDTTKDSDFHKEIDRVTGYNTNSLIAVPIRAGEHVLGVLEGVNLDVEEIESPSELTELFVSIADMLAIVIENGRMITRLDRDVTSTRRLLDISRAVNSTLELADVLDALMNAAKAMMNAEAASLLLIEENEQLSFFVAHGEKRKQLEKQKIPMSKGIAGYCARTGNSVIANDVTKDDRFDPSMDKETGFITRSILCVPMTRGGENLGVLEVINKSDGGEFSDKDRDLLQTIANESALAVRNSLLHREKDELFHGAVNALAMAVNMKDEYEHGHSKRVSHYSTQIGICLRPDDWQLHEVLSISGLVHDVGKIGIPDTILLKSGKLTEPEMAIMKTHAKMSFDIISAISSLKDCHKAVLYHHERFDGTGYPDGLSGDDIPLPARILNIADSFDAITSDRPYRGKKTREEAVDIIRGYAGTRYDPDIVEAFNIAFEHDMLKTEKLPE